MWGGGRGVTKTQKVMVLNLGEGLTEGIIEGKFCFPHFIFTCGQASVFSLCVTWEIVKVQILGSTQTC